VVISIDAMGGDNGLSAVVPGVVLAAARTPETVRFLLHGDEAAIEAEFTRHKAARARCDIRHADRVVGMDEKPAQAMRRSKGTSMWNAVEALRNGEALAAVSAGNTGALMAISKLILRMSADLERPALVASLPGPTGMTTFLDVGANVDCDAQRLVEFAIMGEAFHRAAHGTARPTVGLLNVGSEDMKGHEEVREAHRILKDSGIDLDYRGFVEGDDLTHSTVDVIVTDGFTGNVALKAMEGAAKFVGAELRAALTADMVSTAGALLARKALKRFRARMNPPPAAPLLGLNGIVVKCHGGADAEDLAEAIKVAFSLADSDFAEEIKRTMTRLPAGLAPAAPQAAVAVSEGEA
jgi:glycerol-3-phosphate acyltransferase PlsX